MIVTVMTAPPIPVVKASPKLFSLSLILAAICSLSFAEAVQK